MARSWVIALLEVRGYLRDRFDLFFSLLLPIAIFALMYGAFGGQTHFNGTAYVVNEDGGAYSTLFIERLSGLENLEVQQITAADAEKRLERSDLLMVISIPAGFSSKLAAGQTAEVVFQQRGNGGSEGQIIANLARGVTEQISQELQVKKQVADSLSGQNIPQARIDAAVAGFFEHERQSPTVAVKDTVIGQELDLPRQFLPGIITMFALFAVTLTGRALVEERKRGTLERLMSTRLSVGELFAGKFLANVARGFVQILILLALAYAVFQMFTPLSFGESLVITLVYVAAVSTLGLIIGSLARTEDQASWIAVFFTMTMTMLGGTFFPIAEGSVLDAISKISINTYANDAFVSIIAQEGIRSAVFELAVLGGIAVAGLLISRLIFKAAQVGR